MPDYTYVIVGGGMTAAAAIGGIREVDRDGTIAVIGAEPHVPYDRPPLSKGLWKGSPMESIWRKIDSHAVSIHERRTVQNVDRINKRVTDDQGISYGYSKLLLATGATPRRLPFGGDGIIYFRTLNDYQRLRGMADQGTRFVTIGGGFIGSEIAAALAMNGKQVVMVFPDAAIGGRMFPPELANFLSDYYREKGVEVLAGMSVIGCETRGGKTIVTIRDKRTQADREIVADGVVAGIGVEPNIELAQVAGLTLDNGIRVDSSLRTSDPNIYAAGDVASFFSRSLNVWRRVEHEDNANTMGALAGAAIAGRDVSYEYLPFFYSDLFELGYEAVGDVDSRLEIMADWKTPNREGMVYYLRDGKVRGALLWNIFGQVDAARKLIESARPLDSTELKAHQRA